MASQGVEGQLECPVCLERYEIPKVLPCQHTFCLRCLQRVVGNRNVVKCPECRKNTSVPADGVSGLPTSITLQRLLEAHPPLNVPNTPSNNTGQNNRGRTPTAPPLSLIAATNQSIQHQEENVDLQLALERSAEDEKRKRHKNLQNRNTNAGDGDRGRRVDRQNMNTRPSADDTDRGIPANTQNRDAAAGNNHRRNENQETGNICFLFKKVRKNIRSVAGKIWNNHQSVLSVFIVTFASVTLCRFIAGAVKLSSDCDLERRAALYLFVKACFAVLFWGAIGVWNIKRVFGEAFDNPFVEAYIVLESLFSLCWLFVGTAWIMGNFNNIKSRCPEQINEWNEHFINFALFLTVIDYIGFVVFLFYSGYAICERESQTEVASLQ